MLRVVKLGEFARASLSARSKIPAMVKARFFRIGKSGSAFEYQK